MVIVLYVSFCVVYFQVDAPVKDVSILVTEPSPECPIPMAKSNLLTETGSSTLVHVLVHRESEEYQTDTDDTDGFKGKK